MMRLPSPPTTVLRIGEGEAWPRQYESEEMFFEEGADRSAARALPLLLLPVAAPLRAVVDEADGWTTFELASLVLASTLPKLSRTKCGSTLRVVWITSGRRRARSDGRCHHELGSRFATETMRDCVLGGWVPDTGRRSVVALEEPVTKSLANTDGNSIRLISP